MHNEDSRVKIPSLLHFTRLGYKYQTKTNANIDPRNNVFIDILSHSLSKINNKVFSADEIKSIVEEIDKLTSNSKDKGQAFYTWLLEYKKIKIIDFANFDNNDFRVVTELTFEGEKDNFRPDITILINGIPLGFIEVKKPNNRNGMQAEFSRMQYRLSNPDFTKFFNQFQIIAFTNNMDYDDSSTNKLVGSYYSTPNGTQTSYNNFREENAISVNDYIDSSIIDEVLSDNNCSLIKNTNEFNTNLKHESFANLFVTSIFSIKRLGFILKYGIVYVNSLRDGLQKHIIRYPQFFAIESLNNKLALGLKRGIIWHTQGSGKTALTYFLTNVLRDYYQQQNIITKFYFIVDRLDLLIQASSEFGMRGLTISNINSREDFVQNIKSSSVISSASQSGSYKETMNVVNIQKFSDDAQVILDPDKQIQRIYFLDEVHRGYKPKGTFLANLLGADPNGIYIGLTGTPILKSEFKSTDLFNEYIHKYYYNKSISDGYTLKIKKEKISTEIKEELLDSLNVNSTQSITPQKWEIITKSQLFISKLSSYIENDFINFRNHIINDSSLGFMIVATSTEQAKLIHEWFEQNSHLKLALIIHTEKDNKIKQEEFRGKVDENGEITSSYDGVIVFNMLLTGFDAPRLKRLYLLRTIKEHSLLQTLARVNRPYKLLKYGYVVDFVDITEEYEETNKRYLEELKQDIIIKDDFKEILIDVDSIQEKIQDIEGKLFIYMGNIENNLEEFRLQIQNVDEDELRNIRTLLDEYKESYNELKISHIDTNDIPINRINKAFYEVSNKLNLIAMEKQLNKATTNILNIDIEKIIIEFLKVNEIDLEFTTENDIIERVGHIRNLVSANTDKNDSKLEEIQAKLKDIIKSFQETATSNSTVIEILNQLDLIIKEIDQLNKYNAALTGRYNGSLSLMRVHKRFSEKYSTDLKEHEVFKIISEIDSNVKASIQHLQNPSPTIISTQMKKPIRNSFRNFGIDLSIRQVEALTYIFIEENY